MEDAIPSHKANHKEFHLIFTYQSESDSVKFSLYLHQICTKFGHYDHTPNNDHSPHHLYEQKYTLSDNVTDDSIPGRAIFIPATIFMKGYRIILKIITDLVTFIPNLIIIEHIYDIPLFFYIKFEDCLTAILSYFYF